MDASTIRKIKSRDGKVFEVEEKYLGMSLLLKSLAIDFPDSEKEFEVDIEGKTLEKNY